MLVLLFSVLRPSMFTDLGIPRCIFEDMKESS